LRFLSGETGWQQVNAGDGDPAPFHHLSLQDLPENEIPAAIENETSRLQSSLDLEHGPLIQVAYFDLGENSPGRLFLCIHHLAIDGVSWRVLFEDLLTIYYQLEQGGAFSLPAKSTSFQEWANHLATFAGSGSPQQELDYWLTQPWEEAVILPRDDRDGDNTVASSDTVIVALSQSETQALLKDIPGVYRTQINDLLLTALGETLVSWAGKPFILIDLEGHGREDLFSEVDLSRTVGWFTSLCPFLLQVEPASSPAKSLKSVKEQLRAIPRHGIGYGILHFLSQDPRLEKLPRPEVAFNYLGQFDQMLGEKTGWRLAKEPIGPIQSPKGERTHLLQINAAVLDRRLQLSWGFSREVHRRETIECIAQAFIEALQRLLNHCLSPEAGGFSPSDFDLIDFTQTELDGLWKKLGRDVEDIYPLSPMQEGMLFHTLLDPGSGLYFEQLCCRLKGELQVEAFKQAWQKLVDRHPILRTGFHQSTQRGPFQVTHRQAKLEVTQEDLRGLSEHEQTQKIKNYLDIDREHGFDLEQPPLMRLGLLRLKEMEWKLIWSNHHGLLDGWSLPLLIREMFVYYEGSSQGKSINLRLPQPYRRFIEWLQQQDQQLAEQFWRKELAGFRTPTPLGMDHSARGSGRVSQERAKKRLSLSANTTLAIQKFARDHQLTLNTLVQGAWALLLSRYSGEREVVFGVTVSGRAPELEGIEEMVGLFINALPLRVKLDGEAKLVFWLKEIQAHQAELLHYGYSGLTQIQSWSEIPRGVPLFDSLVVFENYPVDPVVHTGRAGLEIDQVELEERLNFPLSLASGLEDGLILEVNYSSARFDQPSIERLLVHLQTLLESMILDPERKVASLSLLPEAEQQQILVGDHTYSVTEQMHPPLFGEQKTNSRSPH
jgi:non-ribosomal peptide synthase protein (TIGR01720 family)